MGDESDGERTDYLKKQSLDCENIKTRSHSVGSINTLRYDVNKSNIWEDAKKGSGIKTHIDKTSRRKKVINIGTETIPEVTESTVVNVPVEVYENEENIIDLDQVFKPKNSVGRTPPKSEAKIDVLHDAQTTLDSNTQKRQRAGSSPEIFDRQKIRKPSDLSPNVNQSEKTKKDNIDCHMDNEKDEVNLKQNENPNDIKDMLEKILGALKTINDFSENENLTSISKESGKTIRTATFQIHTLVTNLAYIVGQIEKENFKLTNKLALEKAPNCTNSFPNSQYNEIPVQIEEVVMPKNNIEKKKTYSTITKMAKSEQNAKSVGEKWVTPEQIRKHETIVRLKDQDDAKKVLKEIKQNLNRDGNFPETFKSVKQLQSGGVILECHSEKQQKKLKETLEKHDNFQLRELQNTDPMLMITGIEKGYEPEDFVLEFVEQNPQIKACFGNDISSKIKFITRKECRNNRKENWIIQTSPEVFKWIIKNDNLSFDLTKAYIQEYNNIVMCFKCCYFGHVAKYCKGEICCHKCSEKHEAKQCPENTPLNCPSCKRLNLNQRMHSARDPRCPAFVQKLQRQRLYTNYDSNIKQKEPFLSIPQDQPINSNCSILFLGTAKA